MKKTKQSEMQSRVEALEAKMKALVDLFRVLLPEVEVTEADPYSAAFVKFRARAAEQTHVLRR
jgi:hypothetical protein